MKKITIIYLVICFALLGCSQESTSQISGQTTEQNAETRVNDKISDLKLEKAEEIELFRKAVSNSTKVPGIVNVTNPQYQFSLGEESFFLWVTEESGTIMNKDTHTIYTLSSTSAKEVYEFVTNDQTEEIQEVVYEHIDTANL